MKKSVFWWCGSGIGAKSTNSLGAAEVLALVRVVNLRRSLEGLQKMGFWLVGAEVKGEGNLFDFSFPGRAVVVLGSEGRGLAPLTRRTCDFLVAVPHRREEVSSLNVSVAGELFLAEYYRQVGGRVERLQERVSKRLFVRCQAGRG